jgi:hypothetical protein
MSSIKTIILKINNELISAFALYDEWFDQPEHLLLARPESRWGPAQILEHVMLTNHFLLLLLEKGADKAVRKAASADLKKALEGYQFFNPLLEQVKTPTAFAWHRPDHLQPAGENLSLADIRHELRDQLYRCLCVLDRIERGEGVLHTIMLTVNNIGRLDVYQYMHFLVLHMQRHLHQLEGERNGWRQHTVPTVME